MLTRHQLLREAAEKEALASTLTRYARTLADTFEGIPYKSAESESFWKGPAAERYLDHAVRLRSEMDELQTACLSTADNLRRRAEQLREDAVQAPDPI